LGVHDDTPESGGGRWYKQETDEYFHPQLGSSHGPHWDYRDASGKKWRIYSPDDRMEPNVTYEGPYDLTELALDLRALDHIGQQLQQGKTLSRYLLAREDAALGSIVTLLPDDLPPEEPYAFREGYKLRIGPNSIVYQENGPLEPVPNTTPWLVSVVQGYLRYRTDRIAQTDRVCMFEHPLTSSGAPWIAKSGLRPHIFNDEVYFALFHQDAEDPKRIETTIRHTETVWLFCGVMSSLPQGITLDREGGSISRDLLEMLAQRAEGIVVGAYEGESYLLWSKPPD
jgi:hypothetical protein